MRAGHPDARWPPTSCSSRSAPPTAGASPTPRSPSRCGGPARRSRSSTATRPREVRTFALTDLDVGARRPAARRSAASREHAPRAIALLHARRPRCSRRGPGAIRFDALARRQPARPPRRLAAAARAAPLRRRAAARPDERAGARRGAAAREADAVVVPVPVEPSGPPAAERDIAAITYASDPVKKGLPRVLEAWAQRAARRRGARRRHRARRAPPPACASSARAARRSARSCAARASTSSRRGARTSASPSSRRSPTAARLVTTAPPGPYVARDLARELDPRLVGRRPRHRAAHRPRRPRARLRRARGASCSRPFAPAAVDATVANELLPRLLP